MGARRDLDVVDWEEAACGDPVIDVAYARMNMYLMGLPEAADEFLPAYKNETGYPAENLGILEMVAAARPMDDPEAWQLDRKLIAGRFQQFLEQAMKMIGSNPCFRYATSPDVGESEVGRLRTPIAVFITMALAHQLQVKHFIKLSRME